MNCKDIFKYKEAFFKGELSLEMRDSILSHLSICFDCRKVYEDFADSQGLVFDLIREIMKVCIEYDEAEIDDSKCSTIVAIRNLDKKKEMFKKYEQKEDMRTLCDKWVTASRMNDYSELTKVHAIKQIMLNSKNEYTDDKMGESYREFNNFLYKKICQKIDLFERCLAIGENNQ